MAEVYGSIGNEYVELNNAATEATLKLLLAAVMGANKQSLDAVKAMAVKSGLDPATVAAVGEAATKTGTGLNALTVAGKMTVQGFNSVVAATSTLTKQLLDGSAQVSGVMGALSSLPGPIGMIFAGFTKVAQFQEQNLKTYQELSDSGIKFGGSLTTMRQAALNTYMTLDEFSSLMKRNGAALASLGGTANDGAKNFVKLSNSLLSSEAGDSLRALGMTSVQVNEGLASYLTATGGRNKKELENTEAVTSSAAAYMQQIDMLAEVTGKSREETEKALKEQSKNAAWQAQLQGMSEEEKKKAIAGLANALATGGKGAADAFQSKVMGVPPLTKEAQMFTATMSNSNKAIMKSADNVRDSSKTVADQNKELINGIRGGQKDMAQFSIQTQAAIIAGGGAMADTISVMGANSIRANNQSDEALEAAIDIENKKKVLAKTEADDAAKAQKAVNELGQSLMKLLTPIVQLLTPVVNILAKALNSIVEAFSKLDTGIQVLIGVVAALATGLRMYSNAKKAADAGGGGGGTAATKGKGSGMGLKLGGGALGLLAGAGLDAAGEKWGTDKDGKKDDLGKGLDIASTAATWAGMGAMLGPWGALAGGLAGAGYGAYKNFFEDDKPAEPQMADGGVVSRPTRAIVGEAGPEIVAPIQHFENLRSELKMLNTQNAEIIRYLRETADNTRNNVNATRSLSGDLFRF